MKEAEFKPKILIVDDKPQNLYALEKLLGQLQVEVVPTKSGLEALLLTLEHEFCLAIVDVQMPEMDGYEFVELLRGNPGTASLPVIFVSAVHSDAYHHRKGYDAGAVDFLGKPFVPEIFTSKVKVFLDLYRQQVRLQELVDELSVKNEVLEKEIKQRQQAEATLARHVQELARSNADLESFAYFASHDLQEPLRIVIAFSNRLQAKYATVLDDKGRDYIERMQGATRRMQTLIAALLTYSRVVACAQPFVPVDLDQVVREVLSDLEMYIERVGGRVEVGDLPILDADPIQMRQLLQNLIGNGLKFCQEDRSPVVEVYAHPLEEAGDAPDAGLYQIFVKDNGIGFDEKHVDNIFQVFQRLHSRNEYEGSGVGLAICRKIVECHGGSVTASSTPGQGATFVVTLPVKH